MEIRVLESGMGGSFRTSSVLVAQVVFDVVEGFRLVHCDFPTEQDEREMYESRDGVPPDRIEMMKNLGGSGRLTMVEDDSGSRIEIFGSVRALAPALRQAADAFEARLAELPTS